MNEKKRVIAYIDGFNLFYGLKHASRQADRALVLNGGKHAECLGRSLYWLDVRRLVLSRLRRDEECLRINFFTAPRRVPKRCPVDDATPYIESNDRQRLYLEALRTLDLVEVIEGWYSENNPNVCQNCGHSWPSFEEKMTDVSIATQLLCDAFEDRFDRALVMSADADLAPAVAAVRENGKHVLLALPPGRKRADKLRGIADVTQNIEIRDVRGLRLPGRIERPPYPPIECPGRWLPGLGWVWREAPPNDGS